MYRKETHGPRPRRALSAAEIVRACVAGPAEAHHRFFVPSGHRAWRETHADQALAVAGTVPLMTSGPVALVREQREVTLYAADGTWSLALRVRDPESAGPGRRRGIWKIHIAHGAPASTPQAAEAVARDLTEAVAEYVAAGTAPALEMSLDAGQICSAGEMRDGFDLGWVAGQASGGVLGALLGAVVAG